MNPEAKKSVAARVLRVVALLVLIVLAVVLLLLLFAMVPMLLFGGSVQLDSGGFLDLLLRRTQHASGMIPASLVFLGALPLLLHILLLLAYAAVIFSFLRQVIRRGVWLFAQGKRHWLAASVLGSLSAALPAIASAAAAAPVAASGTFAVRPWNPLGGILLFAATLAVTILYFVKTNQRTETTESEEA